MPWVNEIKFAKHEIDTVQEWNQEWDIRREWNEIYFISFTVADQDASWQLLRIHDVDGSYQLWIDPFVHLLSQWTVNEFDIKKWVFLQEKNTMGQVVKPWAVINFGSCVRHFLHGWACKGLLSTKMVFGTEELWWNDLAGRFQISQWKTKSRFLPHFPFTY